MFVEVDSKRFTEACAKARYHGLKYKELAELFYVATSVIHKWAQGLTRTHKDRQAQFTAFYVWVDLDCPGIEEWRKHGYAKEFNPASIAPVPGMGRKHRKKPGPKPKPKPKKSKTEAMTVTVVDPLELDLEEFLESEQKLRAQHALEFAARKAGIALPKATRFAVLLVTGLQSGGVLHNKDFSSLLK